MNRFNLTVLIINFDLSYMNVNRPLTTLHKTLIAVFGLLLWPSSASAHLVTTGLGTFYVASAIWS
jgi:hypothetical protein